MAFHSSPGLRLLGELEARRAKAEDEGRVYQHEDGRGIAAVCAELGLHGLMSWTHGWSAEHVAWQLGSNEVLVWHREGALWSVWPGTTWDAWCTARAANQPGLTGYVLDAEEAAEGPSSEDARSELASIDLEPSCEFDTLFPAQPLRLTIEAGHSIDWGAARRAIDGLGPNDLDYVDFALGIGSEDGADVALAATRELLYSDLMLLADALVDVEEGGLELRPMPDGTLLLRAEGAGNCFDEQPPVYTALIRLSLMYVTDAAGLRTADGQSA